MSLFFEMFLSVILAFLLYLLLMSLGRKIYRECKAAEDRQCAREEEEKQNPESDFKKEAHSNQNSK